MLPKEDTFTLNVGDSKYYWSPSKEATDAATIYRLKNGVDPAAPACETEGWIVKRYTGAGWAEKDPYWFAMENPPKDGDAASFNVDYGTPTPKTTPVTCYLPDTADRNKAIVFNRSLNGGPDNAECILEFDKTYSNPNVIGEDGLYYICAPAEGTINTSHYACDNGHTMQYQFEYVFPNNKHCTVLMKIEDAYCWYCCRHKDPKGPGATMVDGVPWFKANTGDSLKGKQMHAGQLLVMANKDTAITFSVL